MDERTSLYHSRYIAKKVACGDQIVVKVCGGYKIMDAHQYNVWRKQK